MIVKKCGFISNRFQYRQLFPNQFITIHRICSYYVRTFQQYRPRRSILETTAWHCNEIQRAVWFAHPLARSHAGLWLAVQISTRLAGRRPDTIKFLLPGPLTATAVLRDNNWFARCTQIAGANFWLRAGLGPPPVAMTKAEF